MPGYGALNTNKTFSESIGELKDVFRKWGIPPSNYVLPTFKDSANALGAVTIHVKMRDEWQDLVSERWKGEREAPIKNLRALVLALDAARLADQRGLGQLFAHVVTKMLALPPGPKEEEPHDVLGVSRTAPSSIIRAAYLQLVKETHPDTGHGNETEFKRVKAAGEKLGVA